MTKLTAKAVRDLMMKVLYSDEELRSGPIPPEGTIMVEGLMRNFAFHPERLRAAKPEIDALLAELPETFRIDKGGGWSFLNACYDRHDNHWGEHPDMECLVALGIGVGSASWCMKDYASALPGGMPYFEVHPEIDNDATTA